METEQKRIIDRELTDIINFLGKTGIKLELIETGYIKSALSLALIEGYLLALKEAKRISKRVENEINF